MTPTSMARLINAPEAGRPELTVVHQSVSAQLSFAGAKPELDEVAAPRGRTLGQGRGNPPIRRRPGIDKNTRLRLWVDRASDGCCACRAGTQ
jgi:hypothetical protein